MKEQPKWGPGEVTYGGITRSMRHEARLRQQLLVLVDMWNDAAMMVNPQRAEALRHCADKLKEVLNAE